MKKEKFLEWLKAAVARAVRTFAQTAAASIGAAALISDVSWAQVLSASALAAILSMLMSIGGLPEVSTTAPDGDEGKRYKEDNDDRTDKA